MRMLLATRMPSRISATDRVGRARAREREREKALRGRVVGSNGPADFCGIETNSSAHALFHARRGSHKEESASTRGPCQTLPTEPAQPASSLLVSAVFLDHGCRLQTPGLPLLPLLIFRGRMSTSVEELLVREVERPDCR